jgi:uncharacterized protein (DUF885 family)
VTQRAVDDIAAAYVVEMCALDPFVASAVGDDDFAAGLPDFTSDGYLTKAAHNRRVLADLQGTPATDAREEAARAALLERLEVSLAEHDAGLDRLLNARDCPVQEIPAGIAVMPRESREEIEALVARLEAVPEALAGYAETVHEDLDTGLLPARRQVERVMRQCRRLSSGRFTRMVAGAGMDQRTKRDLRDRARKAERGYRRFERFLRHEALERAQPEDSMGRTRFAVALRSYLGEDPDLDEAYEWGVTELERIAVEMADIADRTVDGATITQAFEEYDVRGQYRVNGADPFLRWMSELITAAVEQVEPALRLSPSGHRLECVLGREGANHITYSPAAGDQPARLVWSPESGADQFVTWPHTVSVLHEGVPGRHVLASTWLDNESDLNDWQRHLAIVPGQEDGWAGYAVALAGELGWLDDDGFHMGALDAQRFHTARLVADLGLHCGFAVPQRLAHIVGDDWDADGVLRLLQNQSRLTTSVLENRVTLYLGMPGQGATKRLGERAWLRMREAHQLAHGAGWSVADFHDQALRLGPMGLRPMREQLASAFPSAAPAG